MNTSKFIAIAAAAPMVIGVTLTASAVAAPLAATKLELLTTSPKAQVQHVHGRDTSADMGLDRGIHTKS